MATGKTVEAVIDEFVDKIRMDELSVLEKKGMVNALRKSIGLLPLYDEAPSTAHVTAPSTAPSARAAKAMRSPEDRPSLKSLKVSGIAKRVSKVIGRKLSPGSVKKYIKLHNSDCDVRYMIKPTNPGKKSPTYHPDAVAPIAAAWKKNDSEFRSRLSVGAKARYDKGSRRLGKKAPVGA